MSGNRRRTIVTIAVGAALAAMLASTGWVADNVIKIGALLPMSGPGSYFGAQDKQGIELALEQINKTGVKGVQARDPV